MVKISDLKMKMSLGLVNIKKEDRQANKQVNERDEAVSLQLITDVAKLVKDYSYLKKPSILPKAYEASLIEMKRRIIFRKGLDSYVTQLKAVIETEKDRRNNFVNS